MEDLVHILELLLALLGEFLLLLLATLDPFHGIVIAICITKRRAFEGGIEFPAISHPADLVSGD